MTKMRTDHVEYDQLHSNEEAIYKPAVYNFMWRWSKTEENKDLFNQPEKVSEMIQDIFDNHFNLKLEKNQLLKNTFQIERGDNSLTQHYQGIAKIKTKLRLNTIQQLFKNTFVSAEVTPCDKEEQAIAYCTKPKGRISGPFFYPNKYDGEDYAMVDAQPYFWQQQINDILEEDPHPRDIIWIYDLKGGQGKFTFIKSKVHKGIACLIGCFSAAKDIYEARANNTQPNAVFINVVPSQADMGGVYSAVENIKDGVFNQDKYKSKVIVTKIPHFIIFANSLPNPGVLTIDRWKVFVIANKKIVPITHEQMDKVITQTWDNYDRQFPEPNTNNIDEHKNWRNKKFKFYQITWKKVKQEQSLTAINEADIINIMTNPTN
jgi:hypothetical protein